jgi:hypothetical protein
MKDRYSKRRQLNDELYRVTGCGIQYGGFPCGTCLGALLGELTRLHPKLITNRTWDAVFRFRGDYLPKRLRKTYGEKFANNFEFTDEELTKEIDSLLAALKTCPDLAERQKAHATDVATKKLQTAVKEARLDQTKIAQAVEAFRKEMLDAGWKEADERMVEVLKEFFNQNLQVKQP